MTIDEAILYCEEVADRCDVTDGNRQCADDHRQLAEWLRELKAYRGKNESSQNVPNGDFILRKAAIDAFVRLTHLSWEDLKIMYPMFCVIENLPSAQPEQRSCLGCVHENQRGWKIDICGDCMRNAEDHYERGDGDGSD